MARPIKEGLSYFPLDVDSDYDDKLQLIESLYGPTGFASVIKIFMKIYSVGYYYKWEEKEELLMAKRIGIDSNSLKNIINDCVKYDLFDEELFKQYNILTSDGIQKRFFTAVGKRKVGLVIEDFLLIEKAEVVSLCPKMTFKNVIQGKTQVNQGNTRVIQESSTQSKVKETKVNKTKVNNINKFDDVVVPPGPNAHEFYQNNFGIENSIISQNIDFWIDDLNEELVIEAMSRAALDKKGFRYAEGILKNWEKEGIKTMDEVKSADIAFENSKKKPSYGGNTSIRKETLPDWAKDENQQVEEKPMSEEEKAAFMERLKKIQSFDREKESKIESTLHGFKVENKKS